MEVQVSKIFLSIQNQQNKRASGGMPPCLPEQGLNSGSERKMQDPVVVASGAPDPRPPLIGCSVVGLAARRSSCCSHNAALP